MTEPRRSGLLVTATDTGAGKTQVTAGIARLWRRQRREFAVCKPVATGAAPTAAGLLAEDTQVLAAAAGEADLAAVTPWVFAEPAAPPVAARLAGATLDLGAIASAVERRAAEGRTVLVEGVGGLLCPLTDGDTVADLAVRLGLAVLVVARRSLGTLNHTLLTVEAARARRLRLAGVVVCETTPVASVADQTNVAELRRRLDVPLLAVVPHRPGGHQGEIAALGEIDWWSLAQ